MNRLFQDISLQWKVGGAVFLSLLICFCLVWVSVESAVKDVSHELWENAKKLAQSNVNSDLGAAYAIYEDLAQDIHLDVASVARSADLAFHIAANPDAIGRSMSEVLGQSKSRFSFMCVMDEKRQILGRIRITRSNGAAKVEVIPVKSMTKMPSAEVFRRAITQGTQKGTMLLSKEVLSALWLNEMAKVPIEATPGANAPAASEETEGLVVASIVRTTVENKAYFVFGGVLMNNDTTFVDKLREILYEKSSVVSAGTATIFLRNLRISTNVRNKKGKRATGTLVSIPVEEAVLHKHQDFLGQAFVVDRQFFTAYRPIYDVLGSVVGILYVGVPCDIYRNPQRVVALGLQKRMRRSFIKVIFIGILVTLGIAFLGAKFINRPLVSLKKCTEAIAKGKLKVAVDIEGEDEIGTLAASFRQMSENLNDLVLKAKTATNGITTTSEQIGQTMRDHGSTTAQQSAAVSETTVTLEELAASSGQIAENALQVVKMATKTLEAAQRGVTLSRDTLEKMDEMQEADKDDIERIHALSAKLQRIDEIMELINTIADQTRLIAFNASIEAAGAGEAGKRFGVVSAQIRKLAANTRDRANEIRAYVSEIRNAAADLVLSRERTSAKVKAGLELTENVSVRLEEIHDDSETVLKSSKQISLATQQQRTATEQTLSAVREINDGVNLLATGARDTESEIQKLSELAVDLKKTVNRFEV